jgi:hypothetical protein
MRLVVVLLAAFSAIAIALAAPASGSELLQDPNATLMSLEVNGKGEALLTYRRADGRVRHVLAWGAINARPPTESVPQVRFRWDYAGGWGKYHNGRYWHSFRNRCAPYDGPSLPMLVASCKAPNGTYWTVQAWQRGLPLLGFDPWLPEQSNWELHLSHFSGDLPKLELYANWTYARRWQGVFGRYTYLGQPIFGFGANKKGVPKDKYGRNVYIDTYDSAYGSGWKREAGILTHKGTGTFCHSFVPQRPFAGYPSQATRPPGTGARYRVTAGGPGVTPIVQTEVAGLSQADLERDPEFDALFDKVMAGDRICTSER